MNQLHAEANALGVDGKCCLVFVDLEELLERKSAEFIRSMGWRADRFGFVLERITALLSGLEMREKKDRIKSAHEAERIEIENNPDLTGSDRAERLKAIEESWARLLKSEQDLKTADPEEVELIGENRERLMKTLKQAYKGS